MMKCFELELSLLLYHGFRLPLILVHALIFFLPYTMTIVVFLVSVRTSE